MNYVAYHKPATTAQTASLCIIMTLSGDLIYTTFFDRLP